MVFYKFFLHFLLINSVFLLKLFRRTALYHLCQIRQIWHQICSQPLAPFDSLGSPAKLAASGMRWWQCCRTRCCDAADAGGAPKRAARQRTSVVLHNRQHLPEKIMEGCFTLNSFVLWMVKTPWRSETNGIKWDKPSTSYIYSIQSIYSTQRD